MCGQPHRMGTWSSSACRKLNCHFLKEFGLLIFIKRIFYIKKKDFDFFFKLPHTSDLTWDFLFDMISTIMYYVFSTMFLIKIRNECYLFCTTAPVCGFSGRGGTDPLWACTVPSEELWHGVCIQRLQQKNGHD